MPSTFSDLSAPELTRLYRAFRLLQLNDEFQVMTDEAPAKMFARSLHAQSICHQRHTDNLALNYANKCLTQAYKSVATSIEEYQSAISIASRQASMLVVKAARETLSDLANSGTALHTDLLVFTISECDKRLWKLIDKRLYKALKTALSDMGLKENALDIVTRNEGDEHILEANITPHPDLPAVLQQVCADTMSIIEDDVEIDIFHIPFKNRHALNQSIQSMPLADKQALEVAFQTWCLAHDIPLSVEAQEPANLFSDSHPRHTQKPQDC